MSEPRDRHGCRGTGGGGGAGGRDRGAVLGCGQARGHVQGDREEQGDPSRSLGRADAAERGSDRPKTSGAGRMSPPRLVSQAGQVTGLSRPVKTAIYAECSEDTEDLRAPTRFDLFSGRTLGAPRRKGLAEPDDADSPVSSFCRAPGCCAGHTAAELRRGFLREYSRTARDRPGMRDGGRHSGIDLASCRLV